MGKLVMEDKGKKRQFKPWVYQSNRGRGQTRCNYDQRRFQGKFRPDNAYSGWPRYGHNYRLGQGVILIIEVAMGIIQEVIKGMGGEIIAITEGEMLEIKIMTGIGVGHTKDRAETEGTVEALVIVDQGKVQGQWQMETEFDVLSVGNMITFWGTVQLDK